MSTAVQRTQWRRDSERWPYVEPFTSPSAVLVLLDELESTEERVRELEEKLLEEGPEPHCQCCDYFGLDDD